MRLNVFEQERAKDEEETNTCLSAINSTDLIGKYLFFHCVSITPWFSLNQIPTTLPCEYLFMNRA